MYFGLIVALLIAFIVVPGGLLIVELRVSSKTLRACLVIVGLFMAIGSIWIVRSFEVRAASYYQRMDFGRALLGVQDSLEMGLTNELHTALVIHNAGGWYNTPKMDQISSLREALESAIQQQRDSRPER
jgi:hypothetical protein